MIQLKYVNQIRNIININIKFVKKLSNKNKNHRELVKKKKELKQNKNFQNTRNRKIEITKRKRAGGNNDWQEKNQEAAL